MKVYTINEFIVFSLIWQASCHWCNGGKRVWWICFLFFLKFGELVRNESLNTNISLIRRNDIKARLIIMSLKKRKWFWRFMFSGVFFSIILTFLRTVLQLGYSLSSRILTPLTIMTLICTDITKILLEDFLLIFFFCLTWRNWKLKQRRNSQSSKIPLCYQNAPKDTFSCRILKIFKSENLHGNYPTKPNMH